METFLVVLEDSAADTSCFRVRGSHPLRLAFPCAFHYHDSPRAGRQTRVRASQPPFRNACRLSRGKGLDYSRFARHY